MYRLLGCLEIPKYLKVSDLFPIILACLNIDSPKKARLMNKVAAFAFKGAIRVRVGECKYCRIFFLSELDSWFSNMLDTFCYLLTKKIFR